MHRRLEEKTVGREERAANSCNNKVSVCSRKSQSSVIPRYRRQETAMTGRTPAISRRLLILLLSFLIILMCLLRAAGFCNLRKIKGTSFSFAASLTLLLHFRWRVMRASNLEFRFWRLQLPALKNSDSESRKGLSVSVVCRVEGHSCVLDGWSGWVGKACRRALLEIIFFWSVFQRSAHSPSPAAYAECEGGSVGHLLCVGCSSDDETGTKSLNLCIDDELSPLQLSSPYFTSGQTEPLLSDAGPVRPRRSESVLTCVHECAQTLWHMCWKIQYFYTWKCMQGFTQIHPGLSYGWKVFYLCSPHHDLLHFSDFEDRWWSSGSLRPQQEDHGRRLLLWNRQTSCRMSLKQKPLTHVLCWVKAAAPWWEAGAPRSLIHRLSLWVKINLIFFLYRNKPAVVGVITPDGIGMLENDSSFKHWKWIKHV